MGSRGTAFRGARNGGSRATKRRFVNKWHLFSNNMPLNFNNMPLLSDKAALFCNNAALLGNNLALLELGVLLKNVCLLSETPLYIVSPTTDENRQR